MKKILSIITAGLLVALAVSCNKDEKVTFDASDMTAPVLGTVNVGTDLAVNYTPADFSGKGFNEKMPVYHTLGLVAIDGEKCNVTLSNAKDDAENRVVKLTGKNLNAALQNRGYEIGDEAELEIVVRASIQDPSKGVTNGYVDSEDSYTFSWTLKEESKPGSLPTHDGVRVYVDNQSGWGDALTLYQWGDVNDFGGGWPGATIAGTVSLGGVDWVFYEYGNDIFGLAQHLIFSNNGSSQLADYDITFEEGVADYWLKVTPDGVEAVDAPSGGVVDPYAGFEPTTEWGVIGSIASTGNSWGQDEPMITDGEWFVCRGLELTKDDEFKFRKDGAWAVNFGGDFVALDEEFAVTQDGPNIKVTEDGKYDLWLNPETAVAKIIVAQEAVAAGPYDDFEETAEWGVIGSIASTGNSWGQDEAMLTDGTWFVCKALELTKDDEFKFRKDGAWAVNFGGDFAAIGEEFAVTQDGPNIKVLEDGTYDLLLNPEAAVAKIIKTGDDPEL